MAAILKRVLKVTEGSRISFNTSVVRQGQKTFFTLTVPIDILAKTCFVSSREEDVDEGFQRVLDKKRALEIAEYIDTGVGVIPNSVVLSAQKDADLFYDAKKHTLSFKYGRKAFLIIDGQHRVFGFQLAKNYLRVPVVVFNDLTRMEEVRLFIDINTKQRPVPNELLLDIKRLAEYENEHEEYIRSIYDLFKDQSDSCLMGLLSPSSRTRGKISRVTFQRAMKKLIDKIIDNEPDDAYKALNMYLLSFKWKLEELTKNANLITNPTVLGAAFMLFPDVSEKVHDKYREFTADSCSAILEKVFTKMRPFSFTKPGNSPKLLYDSMLKYLKEDTLLFKFSR